MELLKNIIDYNSKKHGGSDHSSCLDYVVDKTKNQFIPLKFLFFKKDIKRRKNNYSPLGMFKLLLKHMEKIYLKRGLKINIQKNALWSKQERFQFTTFLI